MIRVSGLALKQHGEIICTDKTHSVIRWEETSNRFRVFYYLVKLQGQKYTKPYRLKVHELNYWSDTIKKNSGWEHSHLNGAKKIGPEEKEHGRYSDN